MPTYDYICEKCDHAFEEFQSITAKPLRKCPSCGKPGLKRLIGTGAGVIFKGSGFYETDYRSQTYKDAAKSEAATGAKADTASGTTGKSGDAAADTTSGVAAKNDKSVKEAKAGGKTGGGAKSTSADA